jgi:hypothetical protein
MVCRRIYSYGGRFPILAPFRLFVVRLAKGDNSPIQEAECMGVVAESLCGTVGGQGKGSLHLRVRLPGKTPFLFFFARHMVGILITDD